MSRQDKIDALREGIIAAAKKNGGRIPIYGAMQIALKLAGKATAKEYVQVIENSGFFKTDGYHLILRDEGDEVVLESNPESKSRLERIEDKLDLILKKLEVKLE